MTDRNSNLNSFDSSRILRLRTTMRTNIILRSNSNHKHFFRNSISRKTPCKMTMRRIFSFTTNPYTILRTSLLSPNNFSRYSNNSPINTTQQRILQPNRNKPKLRQNKISPILFSKRLNPSNCINNDSNQTNHTKSTYNRRHRKFKRSKSVINSSPHSTRMILPIRICNSTINPIQSRWCNCITSIPNSIYSTNNNKRQKKQ